MKKRIGFVLVLLMVMTLLCACGDSSDSANNDNGGNGSGDTGDDPITEGECTATLFCEAEGQSQCWYVAPDGDDNASGGVDNPFATIQHGVDVMEPGDYLYLRSGTYTEHSISMRGKQGNENAWFTIKSYPCEWGVVDAGHPDVAGGASVFKTTGTHLNAPTYWRFEHFEVTGGGPPAEGNSYDDIHDIAGAGFHFWPGYHLQFRYMSIHDNYGGGGPNGGAGIKIQGEGHTAAHHVEITNCHLKDNGWPGSDHPNLGNIILYADYVADPADVDIDEALHSNIVAYNLIEGSATGIKTKSDQQLCRNHVGDDMAAKDRGNQIHHNLFIDNDLGIWMAQDFAQIHHNVVAGSTTGILSGKPPSNGSRESFHVVVYNNLVMNAGSGGGITIYHGGEDTTKNYMSEPWHPYWYVWNNILEEGTDGNGHNDINVLFDWSPHQVDMTTVFIDNNYFFPRSADAHVINVADNENDYSIESYMAGGWAAALWANIEDGQDPLHADSEDYRVRPEHVLDGGTTLANGGVGMAHPYLEGVTLPSYVGPCEDADCTWISNVSKLEQTSVLVQWAD